MLKKHRAKKTSEIEKLTNHCASLEEKINADISEIIKIVDSINNAKQLPKAEIHEETTGTTTARILGN